MAGWPDDGCGTELPWTVPAKIDRDERARRMRADFERTMREVAGAVNDAPDGRLIDGSEGRVRDRLGEVRRRSVQAAATQMRVEATEARADLPPGEAGVEQPRRGGAADARLQRPGGAASASGEGPGG